MKFKLWIGVLISAGLLVFLFTRIDLALLWATIKSVKLYYLAATQVLVIFFFWIRAVRWRYLMEPVKKDIPVGSLFSSTMIGFMANNVLPARLGEFIRAYSLGRSEGVPNGAVFATIVVERLFDGLSVLLLLIAALAFMPPEVAGSAAGSMQKVGIGSLVFYVIIILTLGFFLYRPEFPARLAGALVGPFSKKYAKLASGLAGSFITGLGVVKSPRLLAYILFYTAIHWGGLPATVYLLFRAFGMDLGIYAAVFIFATSCIGVALPSTPGYVGTFHAAVMGGLVLLGVDSEKALGFAIVAHAANYIPVTLIGFYCLSREQLSLGALRKMEAAQAKP